MTSTSQLTTSLLHPSLSSGRIWAESQAEVWPQMNCWVFRLQLADRSRTLKRVYSTGRVYHSRLFKYFFHTWNHGDAKLQKFPQSNPRNCKTNTVNTVIAWKANNVFITHQSTGLIVRRIIFMRIDLITSLWGKPPKEKINYWENLL